MFVELEKMLSKRGGDIIRCQMKKKLYLIVLSALVMVMLVLTSCSGVEKSGDNVLTEAGVVEFVNLDGGFYGIINPRGQKYEPINLSKEFQEPGLLVTVDAKILTDVTTHQWGTPIEIIYITKVAVG